MIKLFILSLLLLLQSCAGIRRPNPYMNSINKTLKNLSWYQITPDDNYFRSELLAYDRPTVKNYKDYYSIEIPVNQKNSINCYLYRERLDPAQTMEKLSDRLVKLDKRINNKSAYTYDAGLVSFSPFLKTNHFLWLDDEENPFIPTTAYILSFPSHSLYCYVTFPLSDRSFKTVLSHFIENMMLPRGLLSQEKPKLKEVYDIYNQKFSIGTEEHYVFESNTKTNGLRRKIFIFTSLLNHGSPQQFIGSDFVTSEQVDANGKVQSGNYFYLRNGKVIYSLFLQKSGDKEYLVQGIYYDKQLNIKFITKDELDSNYYVHQYIAQHAKKGHPKEKPSDFYQYLPNINPIKAKRSKIEYLGTGTKGQKHNYRANIHNVRIRISTDESGDDQILTFGKVGNQLQQRALFRQGSKN